MADFKLLLTERNLPLLPTPGTAGKPTLSADALQQLAAVQLGGAVARLAASDAAALGLAGGRAGDDEDGGALAANAPLAMCAWRTRASLSVLVTKAECDDMLQRIRAGEKKMAAAAAAAMTAAVAGVAAAGEKKAPALALA